MREGLLVVFHLPPKSAPGRHNRLRWRVYGRDTSSWRGKYEYHRPGILDDVPHVRLYWGVLILRPEDASAVLALIKKEGGIAATRHVLLTGEDQRALAKKPDSGAAKQSR